MAAFAIGLATVVISLFKPKASAREATTGRGFKTIIKRKCGKLQLEGLYTVVDNMGVII